jgi:hypothetical protein
LNRTSIGYIASSGSPRASNSAPRCHIPRLQYKTDRIRVWQQSQTYRSSSTSERERDPSDFIDALKTLMSRTISIASNVAQGDRNGISEGTND